MNRLEHLLGRKVRVTNQDAGGSWEGVLTALSSEPTLSLELHSGRRVTLPQSFDVAVSAPPEPTGDLAVVRVGSGEVWVRRTIADARRWVTSEPWPGVGPLAAETWDALCESYGPITVLSDGVGEPS